LELDKRIIFDATAIHKQAVNDSATRHSSRRSPAAVIRASGGATNLLPDGLVRDFPVQKLCAAQVGGGGGHPTRQ
jgi:hypothetical protein